MIGIYKVTNTITGQIYIGQSYNIETRIKQHKNNFNNKNIKDFNTKFYKNIRQYGINNFVFEIIEELTTEQAFKLNVREKYWIKYYDSYNYGLNSTIGGQGMLMFGEKHPNAKLSNHDVLVIKTLLQQGNMYEKEIGALFNLTSAQISEIKTGRKWRTVGNFSYPIYQPIYNRKGSNSAKSIFSDQEIIEIRNKYVTQSCREIYKEYKNKCSYTTLERIVLGKSYKNLPIYRKKEQKWIQP